MKIKIKAHPKSKFEKIIEHEGVYHAYFNVPPVGGKANEKVVEMLSRYFKVVKSDIKLIIGKTSSGKVFEINCTFKVNKV